MKNKLSILLVALVLCISAFSLPTGVFADDSIVVEYNKYEAIVIGEPIDIKAKVTRNGETREENIKYTSFDVLSANQLFNTFAVQGYIDGYDLPIDQNIVVIPKDLVYMINAGANSLDKEVVSGGEVLGSELDHTGVNSESEPYFEAIKRKTGTLHNKQAVKQYGVNVESAGDWGYIGSAHLAKTSLTTNQKTPFGMIMYPTRNAGTDVDFKMSIADGSYDLYIGTYSHWFARQINILINGSTAFSQYEIKPVNQIARITEVSPQNGEISIKMQGKTLYEEAMVSFIAVTPHQQAPESELSAPVSDSVMSPEQTQLQVSGLSVGAKLQFYSYDNNLLIKEFIVDASETTVEFDAEMMNFSRFYVRQIVGEVASNATFIQRTDISNLKCEFSNAYVGEKVAVNVTANALSGVANIKIERDGEEILSEDFTNLTNNNFKYLLEVSKNGKYTVTLTSGVGATSISEFVIGNIDDKQLTLDCKLDIASARLSSDAKLVLSLLTDSGSPVTVMAFGTDGAFSNLDANAKTVEITQSGVYTFYCENQVGKTDALVRIISLNESDLMTVKLNREERKSNSDPVTINFVGVNGYEFKNAQVFMIKNGSAERLNVNGSKCNLYENATYYASITNADGTVEICKFIVSEIAGYGEDAKKGCSSTVNGSLILCLTAIITSGFIFKRRK